MLRSLQDLEGFTIGATDGDIGDVKDFYFDDEAWVIRYLVVDTDAWLSSRSVLIPTLPICHSDGASHRLPVTVNREHAKIQCHDNLRLRSCKAMIGYHIHATDGDIGHVETLLINEDLGGSVPCGQHKQLVAGTPGADCT